MTDLPTKPIRRLFQQQILDLTRKTVLCKEDTFDYQFSERWLR